MAKDWTAEKSPTAQAEQNNRTRERSEHAQAVIDNIHADINIIESTLAGLNGVQIGGNDADLIQAIRSLGAYQAILKRRLFEAQRA